jgi:translation elongation factor EF-4
MGRRYAAGRDDAISAATSCNGHRPDIHLNQCISTGEAAVQVAKWGNSLAIRLPAIVVVNMIDRQDARLEEVVNDIYDLFIDLDANDEQIDFPVLYAVSRDGVAKKELSDDSRSLRPLFEEIVRTIPPPREIRADALQLIVANLDYNEYIGRLAIGRIFSGEIAQGETVAVVKRDKSVEKVRVKELYAFEGLKRESIERASFGEIVALAGVEGIEIGETITSADRKQKPKMPPYAALSGSPRTIPMVSPVSAACPSAAEKKERRRATTRWLMPPSNGASRQTARSPRTKKAYWKTSGSVPRAASAASQS